MRTNNKIDLLIHKLAVEQDNLDLISQIKDEIIEEAGIHSATLNKRWLRNKSQPTTQNCFAILKVFANHGVNYSIEDLFEPAPSKIATMVAKRNLTN